MYFNKKQYKIIRYSKSKQAATNHNKQQATSNKQQANKQQATSNKQQATSKNNQKQYTTALLLLLAVLRTACTSLVRFVLLASSSPRSRTCCLESWCYLTCLYCMTYFIFYITVDCLCTVVLCTIYYYCSYWLLLYLLMGFCKALVIAI
jgi:cation transport ATPase